MRKVYILLILGVWVAILPHLGFPYFWKNILTTLSGLGIIYASFVIYKESQIKKIREKREGAMLLSFYHTCASK